MLKQETGRDVSFHSLRSAFATWTFVTWVAAVLGCPVPDSVAEDLSGAESMIAVLGRDPNDVLDRLAALLGHASPSITVSHYLRAVDWFDAMTVRPAALALTYRVVADLLQVSDRWARRLLNQIHAPSVDAVLRAQAKLLA